VTGCERPEEALQKFRAAPYDYDVVVTDLSMPGMSGFDIARELRSIRADMPILMTSGYVRPEDRETARARGIRDLILKPNTVDELGRSLDRVFTELKSERTR
jgi:CheY-like chemotaxis protein